MLRAFSVVAMLLASLAAQDRRKLFGTVVDGDGKPVAGATVQLGYVPLGGEDQAPADWCEATTDARGRFRVDVLPCASYSIWATGPAGDKGRLASRVATTAAGDLVELRADALQPARTMHLDGLDAWRDAGPFTVRVVIDDIVLPAPLAVDEHGDVALPPMPADQRWLELCDPRGAVLDAFSVGGEAEPKHRIAPPQNLSFRVLDDAGQPIAGATVEQLVRSSWRAGAGLGPWRSSRERTRPLGTTDTDGRLTARVSCAKNPFEIEGYQQLYFLARKDGRATSLSGFTDQPFIDGQAVERKGLTELTFHLGPAKPLALRFTAGGDHGLAGQRVFVRTHYDIKDIKRNGWSTEELRWTATTDAEGRVSIDDLPPAAKDLVVGLLAAAETVGIAADQRRTAPPCPLVVHRASARPDAETKIDVATCATLQLRLLGADQAPARGAMVLVLPEDFESCDAWTFEAAPDPAGRLSLRLQPGRWVVFVRDATSMACATYDLAGDQEATLALQSMPSIRGRVVDKQGAPIADANLDAVSMSMTGGGRRPPEERVAESLNWRWIDRVRTDAAGNFVAPFVPLSGASYEAVFRKGKGQSARFRVEASADPLTIIIE